MLANFHTHSSFCDGKNTPEQIVLAAIEKGFFAIGFSGHGYTAFDLRYCMKDTDGYISEINRLKKKYARDIHIYLGVEEDSFQFVDRKRFDYVIGSSHYFCINGEYFPIDSSHDHFKKCLDMFSYDIIQLTQVYYESFCNYIKVRRPDIIGHFDVITKFDELSESLFLKNDEYNRIAERYMVEAAKSGCVFEVNTGAIARNFRSRPYPMENLLYILKKEDSHILLSSDSHSIETLDFAFDQTKQYLYDTGFRHIYVLADEGFVRYNIK